MPNTTLHPRNAKKPAPKWFRKLKKIWSNTENFVLGLLLILGFANDSQALLIIKLGSSFLWDNLETLMANGEEYAPSQNETDEKSN